MKAASRLTWIGTPIPSASLRGLRGNLLSDGVCTFTYECAASLKQSERGAANRLTSVTSGTLTTTFEYDGLPAPVAHRPGTRQAPWPAWRSQDGQVGNRVAQTVDGITTEYVLDVAGGLPEVIVASQSSSAQWSPPQGKAPPWGNPPISQFPNLPIFERSPPWGNLPIYQSTNLPIPQSTNLPISHSPHLRCNFCSPKAYSSME
jgi:YD repeat-containing protein